MIATAIFAGGKLLASRRNSSSSSSKSTKSKRQQHQQQSETIVVEDEETLLDQKLAASLCGRKMDSNPRHLRLTKATSKNDTIDTKASKKAFAEFKQMTRDLSDIIALSSSSSSYFTEQLFDPVRNIRIFTRSFSTFPVDMVKAVFYVPCSPQDFLALLDFDNRKTWDENFVAGEVLYEEGVKNRDDFTIKRMKFDAFPNLVMARDFELGVHTKIDPVSGCAYVKAISTPYEFGSTVNTSSVVRGYIPTSGFVVRPCHVKDKVCREIHDHLNDERTSGEGIVGSSNRGISSLMQMSSSLRAKHGTGGGNRSSSLSSSSSSILKNTSSALFGQVKKWSKKVSSSNNNNNDDDGTATKSSLFPQTATHCEVTYVALVHPRGSIPVMLLNLIIGKQTASMKVLQNAAMKMSLAKQAQKSKL